MPVSNQWPEVIYYRLLIPEILPSDIELVLYCDCDILIRGDISGIFNENLEDYSVAAVEDILSPIAPMSINLGCNPEYGYFNSGVLLINLNYWRERNITRKCLKFINENLHIIKHPDQDALNAILNKSWKRLQYRWNFLDSYQAQYYCKEHMMSDFDKANDFYPIIVHFSGVKPWNEKCRSIYKIEYHEYFLDHRVSITKPEHSFFQKVKHAIIVFFDKIGIRKNKVNYYF